MLSRILILVLVAVTGITTAQPTGFKPVSDITSFKAQLATESKKTTTIKSEFTQVKTMSMLDEKVVSEGLFRFKKENKVRMEYTKPFNYLLVINGDKIQIKDSQKTSSFSARSNKFFTIINNIIIDCVQGTALDNKDFTSKIFFDGKSYLIQLSPAKKEMKDFFLMINVFIDKNDFTVMKMEMLEPTGDNTLINFTGKEINTPIADAEFTVK